MLFEGWGMFHGNRRRGTKDAWAWRSHPFHPDNNISGIDAGEKVHSRAHPAVNAIQAAYIRKVVDTVNDLDNVLYEVINEGGEKEWDWWVVETVRQYERTKPTSTRSASRATGRSGWKACWPARPTGSRPAAGRLRRRSAGLGWQEGQPVGHGSHLGRGRQRRVGLEEPDARPQPAVHGPLRRIGARQPVRSAVGADPPQPGPRAPSGPAMDLAAMAPQDKLASTAYCLADPGNSYAVYLPTGGKVTIDLRRPRPASTWNGSPRPPEKPLPTSRSLAVQNVGSQLPLPVMQCCVCSGPLEASGKPRPSEIGLHELSGFIPSLLDFLAPGSIARTSSGDGSSPVTSSLSKVASQPARRNRSSHDCTGRIDRCVLSGFRFLRRWGRPTRAKEMCHRASVACKPDRRCYRFDCMAMKSLGPRESDSRHTAAQPEVCQT